MSTQEGSVAILMPVVQPENFSRFTERYQGLVRQLSALAVNAYFAEGHDSYDDETHRFRRPFDVSRSPVFEATVPSVVRDLTMTLEDKPLYRNSESHRLVHDPETNRFIANKASMLSAAPDVHPETFLGRKQDVLSMTDMFAKDKVVVKPLTGMLSRDVHVVTKQELAQLSLPAGSYMMQEFIDTSRGIPELGIKGMHNVRVISIGSVAIGAIAREGGSGRDMLVGDVYGKYIHPEDLPDTMHAIVDKVHEVLRGKPGNGDNVIAIDLMRGIGDDDEQKDVLCEVNRRPLRISRWDLRDKANRDPQAIQTMAAEWDKAEAIMLAKVLQEI